MKNSFLLMILFSIYYISNAQTEIQIDNGKTIILNDNGTWVYKNELESIDTMFFDCSKIIMAKQDKITGKMIISDIDPIFLIDTSSKIAFGISVMKVSNSTLALTIVIENRCINNDDYAIILFRDGTRSTIYNNGEFNCSGKFYTYFGRMSSEKKSLELLLNKEIEAIRIYSFDSFVESDLTSIQSRKLKQSFRCLYYNY